MENWRSAGKAVVLEATEGASLALTRSILGLDLSVSRTLSLEKADINIVATQKAGLPVQQTNTIASLSLDNNSIAIIAVQQSPPRLPQHTHTHLAKRIIAEIARVRTLTLEAPIVLCLLVDDASGEHLASALSATLRDLASPASIVQIVAAAEGTVLDASRSLLFPISTSTKDGLAALQQAIDSLLTRGSSSLVHASWIASIAALPRVAPASEALAALDAAIASHGPDPGTGVTVDSSDALVRLCESGFLFNYDAVLPLDSTMLVHSDTIAHVMCEGVLQYASHLPAHASNAAFQPILDEARADRLWRPQLFFEALAPIFEPLSCKGERASTLLRQFVIVLLHTGAMVDLPPSVLSRTPRCLIPAVPLPSIPAPAWMTEVGAPGETVAHLLLTSGAQRALHVGVFHHLCAHAIRACVADFTPQFSSMQVLVSVDSGIVLYITWDPEHLCIRAAMLLPHRRSGRGAVELSFVCLQQFVADALAAAHVPDVGGLSFVPQCPCAGSAGASAGAGDVPPPHCVEAQGFGHATKDIRCALTGNVISPDAHSFWWWCEREVLVSARAVPGVDCPICMDACAQPITLPCGHMFCYLCIKGVAERSRRCAVCRTGIPRGFFWQAKVALGDSGDRGDSGEGRDGSAAPAASVKWYYQGRNGWWEYDERTSAALEESFVGNRGVFELMIAGHIYTVDLETMVQARKDDPSKKRKMLRKGPEDEGELVVQGISGLLLK